MTAVTSFEGIYERQFCYVFGYCLKKLENYHDAEEVTQDAFFDLYRTWGRYEIREDARGLLIQMAKYKLLDFWSARSTRIRTDPIDDNIEISVDHHFEDPFRRDLKEAIGSLKPNQREAVTNYYIRDMSFPETGRAMGVGTSTAEYWVKAGVSKIRRSGTVANEGRAL